MSEGAASVDATGVGASPLADACRYLVCVGRGSTKIVDRFGAEDVEDVRFTVEEEVRKRDSYWIIEQATGERLRLEELP